MVEFLILCVALGLCGWRPLLVVVLWAAARLAADPGAPPGWLTLGDMKFASFILLLVAGSWLVVRGVPAAASRVWHAAGGSAGWEDYEYGWDAPNRLGRVLFGAIARLEAATLIPAFNLWERFRGREPIPSMPAFRRQCQELRAGFRQKVEDDQHAVREPQAGRVIGEARDFAAGVGEQSFGDQGGHVRVADAQPIGPAAGDAEALQDRPGPGGEAADDGYRLFTLSRTAAKLLLPPDRRVSRQADHAE